MEIGEEYTIQHDLKVSEVEITGIRKTFLGEMIYFSYADYLDDIKTEWLLSWWFKYRIIKTKCKPLN